jgi:N-formylglutamate amidohydrolase
MSLSLAEHESLDCRLPDRQLLPLVVASPHSGSLYPTDFLAQAAVPLAALRRAEDAFVDELFSGAPELGAPLLAARFPRSYVDANREPYELDPGMFEGPLPRA